MQFYPDLVAFWARIQAAGAYLAVAGLDRDYARRPFGQVRLTNTFNSSSKWYHAHWHASTQPRPLPCIMNCPMFVFRCHPLVYAQVLDLAAAAATGSTPCVVERLSARCTHGATGVCGRPAVFSQRLSMSANASAVGSGRSAADSSGGDAAAKTGDESVVAIGGGERYQPACELHHVPHAVPYEAWYSDAAAQLHDGPLR